jgi:uncharacterized protein (DUF58 family)
VPEAKSVPFVPQPRTGGDVHREEPSFARTDELTESRRYLPGDDPRRINWKLYGHSGELFVREGEPEPPPRSRYAVVVDTSVDSYLYSTEEGGAAVDSLAERALGLVTDLRTSGLDVEYCATGCSFAAGDDKAAAVYFASVAPYELSAAPDVPFPDDPGTRIVLLALPRRLTQSKKAALDRFLSGRPTAAARLDLLFVEPPVFGPADAGRSTAARLIFKDGKRSGTSEKRAALRASLIDACVAAYSIQGGVGARRLGS